MLTVIITNRLLLLVHELKAEKDFEETLRGLVPCSSELGRAVTVLQVSQNKNSFPGVLP